MIQKRPIPIIDLFAGPGGLGEGFSRVISDEVPVFKTTLSVEKDPTACETLKLRAFYRSFEGTRVPDSYYEFVRRPNPSPRDLAALLGDRARAIENEVRCHILEKTPSARRKTHAMVEKALGSDGRTWVLIGGPPCQAYSVAGRSKLRSVLKNQFYDDERHFLYQEYLDLVRRFQPAVFVMENVPGILTATDGVKPMFTRILHDLAEPGSFQGRKARYDLVGLGTSGPGRQLGFLGDSDADCTVDPSSFVVRAEDHGVPQKRHRVFVLGIRSDVNYRGELSLSGLDSPTVADAIGDLPEVRSGLSSGDSARAWVEYLRSREKTLMRLTSGQTREAVGAAFDRLCEPDHDRGGSYIEEANGFKVDPGFASDWFRDERLRGVCNHHTRGHRADDLDRYLFVSAYGEAEGRSPTLNDFPPSLLPSHRNVDREHPSAAAFTDRFRVQLSDHPATTITSHISKDGHYYVHPDPSQCRSLTVREAARIQTFPDNYFFCGPRTSQYRQVGNAVPPLLARAIATLVAKVLRG